MIVSDVDTATLASATVSITTGLQAAEDVLAFINDGSTMGDVAVDDWNAATGVLTLTSPGGAATAAQWQAALRAVTYTNSSQTPNTTTRTISFVVNDGNSSGPAGTKQVSVASVNDTPTDIALSSATVNQSGGVNAAVGTLSATDHDDSTFTFTLVAGPGDTHNTSFNISGATLRANDAAALAAGTYSVRVQADDGDTNGTFAEAFTLTVVDDLAPAAPSIPDLVAGSDTGALATDNLTTDTTPTFSGTAEAGSTVRLFAGAVQVGSATATGGNWTITASALAGATYSFTATATDAANNVSAASGGLTVTIDTTAPSVTSVAVPANATYAAGQNLDFTVNFAENISLAGADSMLGLTIGSSARSAAVQTVNASSIVYRYTVQVGDLDTDGIAVGALALNTSTLTDLAGNPANLTLNGVGATTAVLVDGIAPNVTSVTSSTANGTLKIGDVATIQVVFSEPVTVTGTPQLTLETGATDRVANYAGGSSTDTLAFSYTVQAGDVSPDLDYAGPGALALNGGTIKDATGNAATLTLPAPGQPNSLGANKALVIDGVVPEVQSIVRANANPTNASSISFTVTFTEPVSGVDTADFTVTTTGTAVGTVASVVPVNASTYTVTVNAVGGNGTLRLDLANAGTGIADTPGNAIVTGFTAGESYTIDTDAPVLQSIARQTPATVNTDANTVTWRVTFDSNVTGVDVADFALTTIGGSPSISITSVTPVTAAVYDVVASAGAGQGGVRLDLDATGTGIADLAGNALANGGFTAGDFYIVSVTNVFDTTMLVAEPTAAQTVSTANGVAQRFTTAAAAPLTLTTVAAELGAVSGAALEVRLFSDDAGDVGDPIATLDLNGTLTANALNVWIGDELLAPNTTYWIVFTATAGTYEVHATATTTNSGGEGAWLTGNYVHRHGAVGENLANGPLVLAIGATSTPSITSALIANGTFDAPFNYQITATNSPTSFAASGLPAGLSVNTATGVISGAPAATGTFNVSISAANTSGIGNAETLVISVGQATATITLSELSATYTGEPHTVDVSTDPDGLTVLVSYDGIFAAPSAVGTYSVVATIDSANYEGSTSGTLTIDKAPQTISFSVPMVPIGSTVELSATASSNLPVTFAVVSGDATITSGNQLTVHGLGTVIVRASQEGDENYLPASVDVEASVTQLTQTITFAALPDVDSYADDFTLTATASSGLPVTFTVAKGPALISGNTLTLTREAGVVTVVASQDGDDIYDVAPSVSRSFIVIPAGPRIFFGNIVDQGGQNIMGNLAAVLPADGREGKLLVVAPLLGVNAAVDFTLNPDGSYVIDIDVAQTSDAPGDGVTTLRGQLTGNVLSGTFDELGASFAPVVQPRGATSDTAGYYEANVLNSAEGHTHTVIGNNREVLTLTVVDDLVAGGATTLAPDSTFALTDQETTVRGEIDVAAESITGTISRPGWPDLFFLGLKNSTPRTDRLANLSARARIGPSPGRTLITGFVIGGSESKRVLLRAIGPGLTQFGIVDAIPNPRLMLYNSSGDLLVENEDWSGTETAETSARVGAFGLPVGSRDAALVTTLAPGAYTMHVVDGGDTGVALAEIFDASENPQAEYQRLGNISSRGTVDGGDGPVIAGFVVTGNAPKKVLVRGIGPGLSAFGVTGVLEDPVLTIYRGQEIVARNDNWGTPQPIDASQIMATAAEIAAATQATGAFALTAESKDAAVLITLAPGAYTAQVSGNSGTTGTTLLEIYERP